MPSTNTREMYTSAEMRRKVGRKERAGYIITAKELCYPAWVISKLKVAETVQECENAMRQGRTSEEYLRLMG